jgi:hypothetical protein
MAMCHAGLYGGLYGQNLPYKFKNSYGDFWNRNLEISGAALFILPRGAWVGSYYGRVTQQGTCTRKKYLQVCVCHTHTFEHDMYDSSYVSVFIQIHELSCVCMHAYM